MKCKFDTAGLRDLLKNIFIVLLVFSLLFIVPSLGADKFMTAFFVSLTVFVLSLAGLIFVRLFNGGVINADEKRVTVSYNFMGFRVFASHIGYDKIESAEYFIENVRSQMIFYYYKFILIIKKKSGRKVRISVRLDIKEEFPTESPEEYKKYLDEQPLMQMCKYINERLGNYE